MDTVITTGQSAGAEIWLPVVGYENRYIVSNKGNLRNLRKSAYLYTQIHQGYVKIRLYDKGTVIKNMHRLVAEAFIPNPKNKPQVNHKNGIKTDNRVENLEWCTNRENVRHAFKNFSRNLAKGERNGNSKLKVWQIKVIKGLHKMGYTKASIGRFFLVDETTVGRIILNQIWVN